MTLGLGSIYLKFHQKYRHGIRPVYYQDRVAPKILQTRPITGNQNGQCEIHVLTWKGDWINVIWMLKSLFHYSGIDYRLCIHEDGTLGEYECEQIRHHFPDSRLITRTESDRDVNQALVGYPDSLNYRKTNPLALKVYDFAYYLGTERMLLLDSDILFFSRPDVLLNRIENSAYNNNTLNKDWSDGYSIDYNAIAPGLNFEFPFLINSGLGLIHKGTVTVEQCEEFLKLPGIMSHHHRIEQTLIALCAARYGFEFLPEEYNVHLGKFYPSHCERHFTGPIRHRMYSEGMRQLVKQGFLAEI